MKWEFKADSFEDAMDALFGWINSGVMPNGSRDFYSVPEPNPERPGYWIVVQVQH